MLQSMELQRVQHDLATEQQQQTNSKFLKQIKKLFYHLVRGLGEGSRVVKKLPSGCREGLQAAALTPGGLLKDCWAPEAPGETFKERLAQPNQGTSQPAEVSHVVAIY